MKTRLYFLFILLASFTLTHQATAQGTTAFTYQGQLRDSGTNANGAYTMTFSLYDAVSGGNKIAGTLTNSPTLANGLFSVNLDFGAGAFDGTARWLEITVGTDTLTPRTQVLPSPYALYSTSAANLTSGTWSASAGNFLNQNNVFGIMANNNLVLGLSTNGVLVNGHLNADQLQLAQTISLQYDGSGGLNLNNGDTGNANLTISNLTANGSYISFPARSGARIDVNANGDFTFDNNIKISSLGVLNFPGPGGGSSTISGVTGGLLVNGTVQFNNAITIFGNVSCNNGNFIGNLTGNVNQPSDRNLKEQFTPVDARAVLEQVAALPISTWNYRQDKQPRHLGPMAQDFYAAFNLGADDKHISTIDENGVALAAIQGLNQKLQDEAKAKDSKIQELEKHLATLEKLVQSLAAQSAGDAK